MTEPTPPSTAGVVITPESRDARKAWVDENPLRAWRFAQTPRLSILDCAELLGVGMSMVQMYERGVHKPSGDRADRFAELLGTDWSDRWDTWLATRPATTTL